MQDVQEEEIKMPCLGTLGWLGKGSPKCACLECVDVPAGHLETDVAS